MGRVYVVQFQKNYSLSYHILQTFKLELTVRIMLKLQNKILRNKNRHLSLNLAFSKIKNISLSQTNQIISSEPPNIQNKALYLDYVQKVLKNKQLDLIQLDRKLTQRQKQINQIQFTKGIGQMIIHMETIKLIEKKLRSVQERMGIRDQQYMILYRKFQADCNKCKDQMEEAFKKQYNDMIHERKILRSKLAQFSELQAYQKYLNELHNALQLKSQQIAQLESLNSQNLSQHQSNQNHQQAQSNFESRNVSQLTNASNRKRIKIFNTKTHCTSQNPNNVINLHKISSPQNAHNHHNETFARNSHNFVTQSSAIMEQQSKQLLMMEGSIDNTSGIQNSSSKNNSRDVADRSYHFSGQKNMMGSGRSQAKKKVMFKQQLDINQQSEHQQTYDNDNYENYQENTNRKRKNRVNDCSTQISSESLDQADDRLRKQSLILKYTKKWLRFSFNSNSKNSTLNRKKLLALNLWRINALFDENIKQNVIKNLSVYEKLWKKQQKLDYNSRMFPYNSLSLKRRKYAQMMFDLQKKIYHRKKIENLLRSILTNRHRKQRLIFFYYFCKFVKNSFNYPKGLKGGTQRSKQGKTIINQSQIGTGTTNRELTSALSSQVLNQQRINFPNRKSTASLTNNVKSQNISKSPSTQKINYKTGKENIQQDKKYQQQQAAKMKQFLAEKERTERLLATQCVKLQGLIKMCVTLTQASFRTNNYAMRKITETQFNDKINTLSSQLNGLEFRFDLVLTKCKLGLANNSNKLSTLENLLDFTNFIR